MIIRRIKRVERIYYAAYMESCEAAVPKFKFKKMMVEEFRDGLIEEIGSLVGCN